MFPMRHAPAWWMWNDKALDRILRGIRVDSMQADLLILCDALEESGYPDWTEAPYIRHAVACVSGRDLAWWMRFKGSLQARINKHLWVATGGREGGE